MRSRPPRVFLLPCIFGDEPPLAEFRAALAGRVAFDLLDYPDIDRPSGEIRNFDGIIKQTVQRASSLQPSGEVHIAGYSFGGLVGFAAACRLKAEGRRVGLLTLLDSRALSLKVADSVRLTRNRDAAPGAWGVAADVASRLLIAVGLSEDREGGDRPRWPDFRRGGDQWPASFVPPERARACPQGTDPWSLRWPAPSIPGWRATVPRPATGPRLERPLRVGAFCDAEWPSQQHLPGRPSDRKCGADLVGDGEANLSNRGLTVMKCFKRLGGIYHN